jgi:tetratricopeptide (TPR) repeat protein
MTRYLAPIGALLLAAVMMARGQNADEKYVWIYTAIQEGDTLLEKGAKTEAANKYADAQAQLRDLQKNNPDWNPKIINYRLGYLASRLESLVPPAPVPNAGKLNVSASVELAGKPASATNAPAAADSEQLKGMQEEITRLNNQNVLLQAKLKEALSVQPAGSDPRDLAKAEDKIRALQKEKDLLQLRLEQEQAKAAKAVDPALLDQEKQLVSDIKHRLLQQLELSTALQQENATLKQQLVDLKNTTPLPRNKAAQQLEVAHATINSLQATNIALRTEQILLTERLAEFSKNAVPKTSVAALERERDDLRQQLELAKKTTAQGDGMSSEELAKQLKIARARLEAFEAQAIPYTEEERALFKQADKKIEVATVKAPRKQSEVPPGAGQLVAEAQRALESGRFDEAEKKYQDVLRQDEKNTYTLVRLAAVQMEQNHLAEAEKNVDKALAIDAEDPLCLYLKGYLKFQQNKFDEALDALSLSAKLLPGEARTQYLLGKVLLQKGAPAQAETALRKAIQLMPGYREAHYSLALVYSKQKPPLKELAQWHYRKATGLGYPADPQLEKQLEEAPTVSSTK